MGQYFGIDYWFINTKGSCGLPETSRNPGAKKGKLFCFLHWTWKIVKIFNKQILIVSNWLWVPNVPVVWDPVFTHVPHVLSYLCNPKMCLILYISTFSFFFSLLSPSWNILSPFHLCMSRFTSFHNWKYQFPSGGIL